MSRSQFHSIKLFILRHAWLNLWDKHMTTGRINQVTVLSGGHRTYSYRGKQGLLWRNQRKVHTFGRRLERSAEAISPLSADKTHTQCDWWKTKERCIHSEGVWKGPPKRFPLFRPTKHIHNVIGELFFLTVLFWKLYVGWPPHTTAPTSG
jgi:hypothetical protein